MPRRPDRGPELAELTIADDPARWQDLGFEVGPEGGLDLGGVRLWLRGHGGARGITSWSIRYIDERDSIDGLASPAPTLRHPPPFATHPNGATGIDHVVVTTPAFDRTTAALEEVGIALRRTSEREGARIGFVRLGPTVLELVQSPYCGSPQARFWGLAIVVINLERLVDRLGRLLGDIRPAIQAGRHIAALAPSAGLSTEVAFMSPE